MYNVIGINPSGGEKTLATGFTSWGQAFDWCAENQGTAAWYRIERYIGPAGTV